MRFIFSILLTIFCLSVSAHSLQKYSGQYNCISKNATKGSGNAIYSYYNNNNNQIYHGKFDYSDSECSLNGQFTNNKQDGIWTFTEKTNFTAKSKKYVGRLVITVSYKDGITNGPVSLSLIDSKTYATIAYIKANLVEGKLVGSVSANMNEGLFDPSNKSFSTSFASPYFAKMSGIFSNDGMPTNEWEVNGLSYQIKESYLPDGSYKVEQINTTTGATVSEERPAYMPNMIVEAINYALRKTLMRDSEKIQLPLFEFGDVVKISTSKNENVEFID